VAAAHALLDKHAREAGDLGIEISVTPPRHPYPEQEQLGVRHYKLSAEARKQARALGIRASDLQLWAVGIPGGDLRARVSRMVRHAVPFDHKIANVRYRGTIMRVEDDTVTWIGLAVRHGVLAGPALARRSNRSGRRVPRSAAAQRSRLSATLGAMSASVPLMAGRRG
jgi:hypothetical protein